MATLGCALADFDHSAVHREFHWDLAHAYRVLREYRPLLTDRELGGAIDTLVAQFDLHVGPVLNGLPRRTLHNDLNDYNVLVDGALTVEPGMRVTGIVDFGDMVHGYAVADLAIAAAYAMLGADDPLASIAQLVRGHTAVAPLAEVELRALFGLSVMRLAMSACIAAHQRRLRPDNDYLDVSQAAIRRVLPQLARVPFRLAEAICRDAAGLEPSPSAAHVRSWLAEHSTEFAPVLPFDLRTEPALVLDLSVASPLVRAEPAENAEPLLTARVTNTMREAGLRVSVGRYDEPRLLYSSTFFGETGAPLAERRTIHLRTRSCWRLRDAVHSPLRGPFRLPGNRPAR